MPSYNPISNPIRCLQVPRGYDVMVICDVMVTLPPTQIQGRWSREGGQWSVAREVMLTYGAWDMRVVSIMVSWSVLEQRRQVSVCRV